MPRSVSPTNPIHPTTIGWIVASLALVIAPHTVRLPIWVPLLGAAFATWRWLSARNHLPLPGLLLRFVFVISVMLGIYFSYGRLFGRDAGTAWLIILITLKLMELRTQRDAMIVIMLGYFLVITNFLYTQTIPTALYMVVVVLVLTATLVAIGYIERTPLAATKRLRIATTLLLQALPMMLILFLLFPRIPGPLWGMPSDAHSGTTGLSEDMSPGSISQLSQSDAVAFRIDFIDPPPPMPQRYWRGPVLWHFDGRRWSSGFSNRDTPAEKITPLGESLRYNVTLEPHNKHWLFALELPESLPSNSQLTADYQLLSNKPVRQRLRYQASSYSAYRAGEQLSKEGRAAALQLPGSGIDRARQLAGQWRDESNSADQIVQRALSHFNREPFSYTLLPPLLGRSPVDEFLFDSRRGFCEHYAGAFTVLMRAAGVPARVVTGYHGGTPNPVGNYYIVRQSDAHAWAEVWLEGRGWVRIDPTAAVAPERVEIGIQAAVPLSDPLPAIVRSAGSLLQRLRLSIDAINNGWNQWVLGYNTQRQMELLSRIGLGLDNWKGMVTGLMIAMGAALSIIAGFMLWRHNSRGGIAPELRHYQHFCRKLAQIGIERSANEGPEQFASRIINRRPELAEAVEQISQLFITLRYRGKGGKEHLNALKDAVTGFSPKRR